MVFACGGGGSEKHRELSTVWKISRTNHLNILELVATWSFLVLLASYMGHIAPVVRAIWHASRVSRAIEDEAINAIAVLERAQAVDACTG